MKYAGIDPGYSGGLAFFDDAKLVFAEPMPVIAGEKGNELDMTSIAEFLCVTHGRAEVVFIERAQPMCRAGATGGIIQTFNFAVQFGLLRGLCHGLGLSYYLIHPQVWQRALLGTFPKGDSKAVAAVKAQQLWPTFPFRASTRCKKNHEGMVDAALIGNFGRLAFYPKEVPV